MAIELMQAKLSFSLKGLPATGIYISILLGTLVIASCGGDEVPAGPDPRATSSIVGRYSGTYDYVAVRNMIEDQEASLHCPLILEITFESGELFGGWFEAVAPASGCGEPGTKFLVFSGRIENRNSGTSVELTVSPGLSSRVTCVAIQINTLSGTFGAASPSGAEVELQRDFVCTDNRGDWLTVRVTYTGSLTG